MGGGHDREVRRLPAPVPIGAGAGSTTLRSKSRSVAAGNLDRSESVRSARWRIGHGKGNYGDLSADMTGDRPDRSVVQLLVGGRSRLGTRRLAGQSRRPSSQRRMLGSLGASASATLHRLAVAWAEHPHR